MQQFFTSPPEANAYEEAALTDQQILLAKQLIEAFHDKTNPEKLGYLISQGAPIKTRLDYGLEINIESEFVYALFLLLECDKGEEILKRNIVDVFSKDGVANLFTYVRTAKQFFDLLHARHANLTPIPVSLDFTAYLLNHAISARFNPEVNKAGINKNGSLIIAAGLRDPVLVYKLIALGASSALPVTENGAYVNFRGYFDSTAIEWSAIMLDGPVFNVLHNQADIKIDKLNITESSVLHYLAIAVKMLPTAERIAMATRMINEVLVKYPAIIQSVNTLGLKAADYLPENLHYLLNVPNYSD
jgi:hypothetical protein